MSDWRPGSAYERKPEVHCHVLRLLGLIPTIVLVSHGRARAWRGLGIAVLALLFASAIASTRLAADAQMTSAPASPSYVVEEMASHYQVQTDGSWRRRMHVKIKVADQAGVTEWSTLLFPYMAATENVSIQQLMIEKPDGRQVKASSLALEDAAPPTEIDAPILSDTRMKKIAVPALEPGDRLIYDVLYIRSASLIPGQFWFDYTFTRDAVVIHESVEVDAPSSRALNVRLRRDGSEVAPGPTAEGRIVRRWTHQQMVPIARPTTEEAAKALAEEQKKGADLSVSSFHDWQQLGEWFGRVIDAKTEPDEDVRARARELTRGLDTAEQKLAALYSFVSTQIRYISLAFGSGRLEPRSASQVLATQYGDCKDKHVLLASLARAIELDIKPVLISSGYTLDEQIPTPSQFDHVISVRTAADTSAWHWMDSTSGALPPGVLLEPFRDKRALLVPTAPIGRGVSGAANDANAAARTAAIVTTPADGQPDKVTIDITGTMTPDLISARVVRRFTGDTGYGLRLLMQSAPQEAIVELGKTQAEEDNFGKTATVTEPSLKDDGLSKGVVMSYAASLPMSLTYDKPWQLWLTAPRVQPSAVPSETDTEIELDLDDITLTVKYEVPASVRARPPVPISLDRDFASYTSTYKVDGQTLFQERRLQMRTKKITAAQMDGFRAFLRAIDADFRQQFAIEAIPRTSGTPQTADELNRAGHAALEKRRMTEAIDLLKRATTVDPKHKTAWVNLGRAYNIQREFTSAIEALERQIALNPYDEFAYSNLGFALRGLKRNDEAIAQYKKQIEIVPLDKWTHAELGDLYVELKRWDDAVASLEKAVGITPENSSAWFGLGQARLGRNDVDEAAAAYARAVELKPTAAMWNEVAWAFAEKGVKLDAAKEYVRKAIDAVAASLQNITLEKIGTAQIGAAEEQARCWDTLGWIYFQSGDLVSAERWVRASWLLGQHPVVGEHLGTIYEKQGKRTQAAQLYAQSAGIDNKHAPSREALERLVGAKEADMQITAERNRLVEQRTVALPRLVSGAARADVVVLVAADGRVSQVVFVKGDERLRAPVATLKALKVPAVQPDAQTMTFVRAGMVGCSPTSGCVLILMRPEDAPPPPSGATSR
jgi:tetratricopeptide (TPR) repeat protein/transglutaminase-like putative cysteine protease